MGPDVGESARALLPSECGRQEAAGRGAQGVSARDFGHRADSAAWLKEVDMLGRLARRLMFFLRREQRTAELEEEMRLHLELRAQKYGESGLDAPQAGALARR